MNFIRRILGQTDVDARDTQNTLPLSNGVNNEDTRPNAYISLKESINDTPQTSDADALPPPPMTPVIDTIAPSVGNFDDSSPTESTNDDLAVVSMTVENISPDDVTITKTAEITTFSLDDFAVTPHPYEITPPPFPTPMQINLSSPLDGVTRPLPQEVVQVTNDETHAIFGQATNIGKVRGNNEDSVFTFLSIGRSAESVPDFGLLLVADGMGGHQDGEKASMIAAQIVSVHLIKSIYMPMISNASMNDVPIAELMTDAVQKANAEIVAKVPDGGTTITAAVMIGDRAYIAHVGDSRAYLLNKGGIEQLTRDHSLVQRLLELDHITPEQAVEYPNKNVLYRALGQNENLEVDTLTRRLPPHSCLLICSDGLTGYVGDAEIAHIVYSTPTPQEACQQLIALANSRGGVDNITVTILETP